MQIFNIIVNIITIIVDIVLIAVILKKWRH
mgnify:CR=1 FL=1